MKKTGSNVVSFPKPRRLEQTGFTQKGFPARWLGLILMTTVGAAWALSPNQAHRHFPGSDTDHEIESIVFQGEPQVVAQLMSAVIGPKTIPTAELKTLSALGASDRRVVVSSRKSEDPKATSVVDEAEFYAVVERVEGEMTQSGVYPSLPATGPAKQELLYKTNGQRFKLRSGLSSYDSQAGVQVEDVVEDSQSGYAVNAYLASETTGWGPWRKTEQVLLPVRGSKIEGLTWLANQAPTPSWSATMYFPIGQDTTGYAFRRGDGSSAYKSGEFLYDAVTGTFQLKLHRKEGVGCRSLAADKLEKILNPEADGCEVVGDAGFLSDLGLLPQVAEEDGVVQLSTPNRLSLTSTRAIDGLTLSTMGRRKRNLKTGTLLAGSDVNPDSASLVGKFGIVDKVGQVHEVRFRGGRATDYDWMVGQLCPLGEELDDAETALSSAYEDGFDRKVKSTVLAGK